MYRNIKILTNIHYKAEYGDNLYISGNIHSLGNWNVCRAILLYWT